jgi:hypothetical protein
MTRDANESNSAQMATPAPASPPRREPTFRRALSLRRQCQGEKLDGSPCRATPAADGFCTTHTSRYSAEDRRVWRSRGRLEQSKRLLADKLAKASDLPADFASDDGVRKYLEQTANRVAEGRLLPSQAAAIKGLIDSAIRLAELAADAKIVDLELAKVQAAAQHPRVNISVAQ